ncbi:MAG: hypothetical protein WCK65_09625 [Rhodospirillaceae bacterium]
MAFKPNYNQQRSERTRAKQQKKQEKLQRRQDEPEKSDEMNGDQPNTHSNVEIIERGGDLGS